MLLLKSNACYSYLFSNHIKIALCAGSLECGTRGSSSSRNVSFFFCFFSIKFYSSYYEI